MTSLKGRKQSPEHIAARVAARKRNGTDKGYKITKEGSKERYSEATRKKWAEGVYEQANLWKTGRKHSPETIEKMREKRKQMWAEGRYDNKKPANRRAVSNQELALVPYLAKLGYRHNDTKGPDTCFIACSDRTRVPDFVDTENRRVFEFFGNFWHHPDDELAWIEAYREKGWECTVLWEDELMEFLKAHEHLVSPEDHLIAVATARPRHRYSSKGNELIVR